MISVVGVRYAKALLDIVMTPGSGIDPHKVLENLRGVAGLIDNSPNLKTALLSPAVSPSRKRAVVGRLMDTMGVAKAVRNLIFVVIDHRRVMQLDSIVDAYENLLDERLGFVRADVSSARELNATQRASLEAELSRLANKKAKAAYAIDPALIGGVMARVGSIVYDGSVRGELARLKVKLLKQ
jgi:F-type H+-transporting ATPase subunit delta